MFQILSEIETVLVEIRHTLNSRLLTYMSDENFVKSITTYYLLYGHDVNRKNSDINHFTKLSKLVMFGSNCQVYNKQ